MPASAPRRERHGYPLRSGAVSVGLNIGAGHTYIPGFVNVDISERAEVTLDLSKDRLPFDDNSVDTVVSIHTLEHVPDYLHALGEIHRVLRHDGALLLKLPYVTLTEAHMINPYHLHNFSERSFDFFDPERLKGSAGEESRVAFRKVFVRYTYLGSFGMLPGPLRVWARRHLFNVVRQFDVGLVAIKDDRPVDAGRERSHELQSTLRKLASSRVPYEDSPAPHVASSRDHGMIVRGWDRVQRRTRMRES